MADTTPTSSKIPAKPAKRTTARRKPAAAKSTGGTATTARRKRTAAVRETRAPATVNARAAAESVSGQSRSVAERAALVSVGATLEVRDRALALVGGLREATTSRTAARRRISGLERRGNSARTRFEHDVRTARTRVQREAERRRNVVAEQVARVETVVQAVGVAGERIAATAKDRVGSIA
jgi:hypothetical protein